MTSRIPAPFSLVALRSFEDGGPSSLFLRTSDDDGDKMNLTLRVAVRRPDWPGPDRSVEHGKCLVSASQYGTDKRAKQREKLRRIAFSTFRRQTTISTRRDYLFPHRWVLINSIKLAIQQRVIVVASNIGW